MNNFNALETNHPNSKCDAKNCNAIGKYRYGKSFFYHCGKAPCFEDVHNQVETLKSNLKNPNEAKNM